MKSKSILGLTAACAAGLGLTITLPLVLSSCSNTNNEVADQNPISFSGTSKPVMVNQKVTITGHVQNPNQYLYSWCYSQNGSSWVEIKNQASNQLVIPAENVTTNLNHYEFRLTICNKQTGQIYSATTKVQVVEAELSVSRVSVENSVAVINVTPVKMQVTASSNLKDAHLNYQWQYRTKASSVVLNNSNKNNESGWTNCQNANSNTLLIPASQVNLEINNYEFRCLVTLANNESGCSQASKPVSIQAGYAVANPKIELNVNAGSSSIIQNQTFSLTATSNNYSNLNYQWYYKSPVSSGYSTNVSNTNPLAGWNIIKDATQANLDINSKYVTQQLVNTEFMVVGYESNKLSYNTAIYTVKQVTPALITVNLTKPAETIYEGQTITLTAEANCSNVTNMTFKYEWSYAEKNGQPLNWQVIPDQNQSTLVLNNVNEAFNNYQFKCRAINTLSDLDYGDSQAISLDVKPPVRNENIQIAFQTQPGGEIYPNDDNVKIIATATCDSVSGFTYKWWYKQKTPSSGDQAESSQLASSQTPEANGWTSIECSSDTLSIPKGNVSEELNNYEFLCQAIANNESWNFNYATTTIKVSEPLPTIPNANTNIAIEVTGNDSAISGQNATLKACATCNTPTTIQNFGYQWYYKEITPVSSNFFFKNKSFLTSNETSSPTDPTSGWTKVPTNGNKSDLEIPSKFVTPQLVDYQFMCVAYQSDKTDNYNVSAPVQFGGIQQQNISCNQTTIKEFVDNVTMKWDNEYLQQNCVAPNSENPCEPATANPVLTEQIAKQLGILSSNIDKIYIQPGSNIWPNGKFMVNIQIVLKNNNTFQEFSLSNNSFPSNNKTQITASGNTLTMINLSTNINPKSISFSNLMEEPFNTLSSQIIKWNWSNINSYYGQVITYSNQSKPLFDALATFFNVPVYYISNVTVKKNIKYPKAITLRVFFNACVNVNADSSYCVQGLPGYDAIGVYGTSSSGNLTAWVGIQNITSLPQ